jgi:hypothetical protein
MKFRKLFELISLMLMAAFIFLPLGALALELITGRDPELWSEIALAVVGFLAAGIPAVWEAMRAKKNEP